MREVSFYGRRRVVSKQEMKPSLEVVGGVPPGPGRAGPFFSSSSSPSGMSFKRLPTPRPGALPSSSPSRPRPSLRSSLSLSLSLSLSPRAPRRPYGNPRSSGHSLPTKPLHSNISEESHSKAGLEGAGEGGGRDQSEASSATLRLVRLLEPRSRHGKVRPVGELSRRKTELRVSNVKQSRRSPASSGCPALPPPQKAVRCLSEAGDELLSIMVSWPPQGRSLLALSRRGGQVG